MKRIFLAIFGVLAVSLVGVVAVPEQVMAEALPNSCGTESILGMRPWYAGLCDGNDKDKSQIKTPDQGSNLDDTSINLSVFVWTIILNVLFDLTVLIGYIALGFVIYGGYLYIMSQGDPGRAVKGKKTLTSAIIGVVIAMAASIVVNTVIYILGIDTSKGANQTTFDSARLQGVFDWAYSVAGLVAVVFIIKSGVDYMLSQGDPGKIQQATRGITYSIIGLIVVLLAAMITGTVISSVGGAM